MNTPSSHPIKANYKEKSEDILQIGDYCIVENMPTIEDKIPPRKAVIVKCPFCKMEIATTGSIEITKPRKIVVFARSLFGFPHGATVNRVIQCPYGVPHAFKIINGQIIAVKKDGETRSQKIN